MKLFLFCFLFMVPAHADEKAGEKDLGTPVVAERLVKLSLEECGKNWVVDNRYATHCEVHQYAKPAFLLNSIKFLGSWRYNSGDGWSLTVSAELVPQGFRATLIGEAGMPDDRLQFVVGKKYIRKLFNDMTKQEAKVRVLRAAGKAEAGETVEGEAHLFRRKANLADPANLSAECEKRLTLTSKKVCILHFAAYSQGEVVLSTGDKKAEAVSADKKNKVTVLFSSTGGWQTSGPFSLSFMRTEYKGAFDVTVFRRLFAEAVKKLNASSFDFSVIKKGKTPESTSRYSEEYVGATKLFSRNFAFDIKACEKNWVKIGTYQGGCSVATEMAGLRVAENRYLVQQSITSGNATAYMGIWGQNKTYSIEAFGSEKTIEKFAGVKDLVNKLVAGFGGGRLSDYALVLP